MLDTLSAKAQHDIMDALHSSASIHAERSNGLFCAYEPDLARFPYQNLSILTPSHYKIKGAPLDVEMSDAVASTIDRRYKELPTSLEEYNQRTKVLTQAGEILKSGQNVIIGLEHAELVDLPFATVGVSNFYRRLEVPHRSAMIVSKAMDFLGVRIEAIPAPRESVEEYLGSIGVRVLEDDTVPARDFLRVAADLTFLTMPSTQSFEQIRKLEKAGIKEYNRWVRQDIRSTLSRRSIKSSNPLLLMVALPGTTNKLLDIEIYERDSQLVGHFETAPSTPVIDPTRSIEVIGKISDAITSFSPQALTFAGAVRLDQTPPAVEFDGNYVCVREKKDIGQIALMLVEIAGRLEPTKDFLYDAKGNLPVVRK